MNQDSEVVDSLPSVLRIQHRNVPCALCFSNITLTADDAESADPDTTVYSGGCDKCGIYHKYKYMTYKAVGR